MRYPFQFSYVCSIKNYNNLFILLLPIILLSNCSIKKFAVNSIADSITEGTGSVFASDDDPELIAQALPFTLKSLEALHKATPENQNLLLATASGFVQYGHAFILPKAEDLAKNELEKSRHEKLRAKKIFVRARDYCFEALELKYPGIVIELQGNPVKALLKTDKSDVPLLYWTGVAWISAIVADKTDLGLVADLQIVTAIMETALKLDPDWDQGTLHEFFIAFNASRSAAEGGGIKSAEEHYNQAMKLNKGKSITPVVSLAESVCIPEQDYSKFETLLVQVLEFDVNQFPENRLANILAQRKAKMLLDNKDLYFVNTN